MRSILIAAIAAAFATAAQAEFFSGTMILDKLQGTAPEQNIGAGYILGVADAHYGTAYCPPNSVTAKTIVDVVQGYLVAYPAQRAETGDVVVLRVISAAWPCRAAAPARSTPKTIKPTI